MRELENASRANAAAGDALQSLRGIYATAPPRGSRDSGLRERIRAEQRIKRLEEEMSILERSREEDALRQEEIREAQETARLERKLFIAEAWCKGRGHDDFCVLESGHGCKRRRACS
ncbi:hypothetical protein MRX96_017122 [Rhipicephalus microplus]